MRLRAIKKRSELVCGESGDGEVSSQAWWYNPAISALGQGDYKLETSLGYIERPSPKNLERVTNTKVGFQKNNGGKQKVPCKDVH